MAVAVVVALCAASWMLPPVRARGKAAAVLAESVGLPFPRPFARDVARTETVVGGAFGDLYDPGGSAPPVLLLPGATRRGRADPRVVRVATALARADRLVFVPELVLYERRLSEIDLERIVRAALGVGRHPRATGAVTVVGFSYGASLGLVAAADPRLFGRLEAIATFGAYYDLAGVVQAATTGVSVVDGERLPWDAHPSADRIVREAAVELAPPRQRQELAAVLEGRGDERGLGVEARAIARLLRNRDPDRTAALVRALPPGARERLARLSPSSVAGLVGVPVLAMHSRDDPAVPYAEGLRLERGLPGARLVSVGVFDHVDFRPSSPGELPSVVADLWRSWRFASWVLGSQE